MSWFARTTRKLDRALIWIAAIGTVWAAMTWVATRLDVLGNIGWAEAVFLGLGAACSLAITIAIVLIGWRLFNPIPSNGNFVEAPAEAVAAADIDARLSEFFATKLLTEFARHSDIHSRDEKLARLADALRTAETSLDGIEKSLGLRVDQMNERLETVDKERRLLQQSIEAWFEDHARKIEQRFEWIDQAFATLSNREWHSRLFDELEDDFDLLAQPIKEGVGIIDWEAWSLSEKAWRGKLDQWLVIADYYAIGTTDTVRTIPDSLYYGEWTHDESQFETADQVRRYKEFAILWHNAKEAKPRVDRCISRAAFETPSKKGHLERLPPKVD